MINVEILVLKIHSNIIISKDHNYCYQVTTSLSIYVLSNLPYTYTLENIMMFHKFEFLDFFENRITKIENIDM